LIDKKLNRRRLLQGSVAGPLAALPAFTPVLAAQVDARAERWAEQDAHSTPPPPGAIVLFGGRSLVGWQNRRDGAPAGWKVENGYMEVRRGNGDIHTQQTFEDCQLHVEFWLPHMPEARGQARANSGVYLQGRYEVQVLDSYGLDSKDNDCGGIYGVAAPLRNACKKPERWQSYDIAFRAPRFGADGKQTEQGRITVFHNGVLIHSSQPFDAGVTTAGVEGDPNTPGPILLQDHGDLVRYRNVWLLPVG
jgi:hypothetical protein